MTRPAVKEVGFTLLGVLAVVVVIVVIGYLLTAGLLP